MGLLYEATKWAYQPIKHAKRLLVESRSALDRKARISEYLTGPGFKGLQIGSGSHHRKGWLNSDISGTPGVDIGLDITKRLPFPPDSLDAIYGSEVIEHIPKDAVVLFCREAVRVLKPKGVLRLTTPDIIEICRITLDMDEQCRITDLVGTWVEDEGHLTRDIWINAMFRRWGHQYLWDFASLNEVIRSAGFDKVERVPVQVTHSGLQELANQETRYGMPPPSHCWSSSMILEATK
jgi:predicted SAM-dependent methyltransferase